MGANRAEVSRLLAEKLESYRGPDAVVLTIPAGDVNIGRQVARHLGLHAIEMPCLEIRHPANRNLSIGSVCLKNVVVHAEACDIPQEYIQHKITRLRAKIRRDMKEGDRVSPTNDFRGKTIIVVSDWLKTADRILACLHQIRKDDPARIVVAAASMSRQAFHALRDLADDCISLSINPSHDYTGSYRLLAAVQDSGFLRGRSGPATSGEPRDRRRGERESQH